MADKTTITVFGVVVGVLIILPLFALSVTSFVIAERNKGEASNCKDSDATMTLYAWLIGMSSAQMVFIGVYVLCGVAALVTLWADWNENVFLGLGVTFIVTEILYLLFAFAWNIVGWIVLFDGNSNCRTEVKPLWAMTLAQLIICAFSIIVTCISNCHSSNNDSRV